MRVDHLEQTWGSWVGSAARQVAVAAGGAVPVNAIRWPSGVVLLQCGEDAEVLFLGVPGRSVVLQQGKQLLENALCGEGCPARDGSEVSIILRNKS